MVKKIIVFCIIALTLSSCASRKKIVYFQNISELNSSDAVKYEPRLQPDDLLMIVVSAETPEAAAPYNLPAIGVAGLTNTIDAASGQLRFQSYLVDNNGYIQFPGIGPMKLGGLTRAEAMKLLTDELVKYINKPIVNMRIINYKITVMGEVNRPNSFNVVTERITLPEAISMAGDMTIYGTRSKVMVIREIDGQKTYNVVDMTKADFINSPFYYLSQNDLVYVEPNKTRINSSSVGPNITIGISALSLVITIISIATRR